MLIHIKNLRVQTIIGVHAHEQEAARELVLQVALLYDAEKAAESDNIKDALDYEKLANKLVAHVKDKRYQLLERLAAELADLLMKDTRIEELELVIEKAKAIPNADAVIVTERRRR